MDFLGMGMGEILLILIVALIIWGPGRMPEIARTIGKTVRTVRKATTDLTSAITKEIDLEEKSRPSQSRAISGDKTKESSDVDKAESSGTEMTGPRDK